MHNYAFVKENLDDITLEYFKMVAITCMNSGINSICPFGCSGDNFMLYGKFIKAEESEDGDWHRKSMVSLRNYFGSLEMLVTDKKGRFLVYSKVDGMSVDEVVEELFREFCNVKHLVDKITTETFKDALRESDNVELSEGFKMLEAYYLKLESEKETIKC